MPGRPDLSTSRRADLTSKLDDIASSVPEHSSNKLTLSQRGLVLIPKLDANLVELDLSCNSIVRTTGLANLCHLQKLVLTSNHITELHDLTGLPALQHLLLQGNFLCTLQDISLNMLESGWRAETLICRSSSAIDVVDLSVEAMPLALVQMRRKIGLLTPPDAQEALTLLHNSQPNISKHRSSEVDITSFLPPDWGTWLTIDDDVSTQNADSELPGAGAATAKVLDGCIVLSSILKNELVNTAAKLK